MDKIFKPKVILCSFLVWLLITTNEIYAQDYTPFPTGKAVWTHKADYYLRNIDRPDGSYTFYYCQCGADTLIDGKTYRKISYLRPEFEAVPDIVALREQDKRIYYRPINNACSVMTKADSVLYDFNLKPNDTLKIRELICAYTRPKLPFKLLKIDTVEHWGVKRVAHIYDDYFPFSRYTIDRVFEGIGGTNGLLTLIHYFPEDPGFPQRTWTYLTGFSQDRILADSLCKIIRNGVIRGRTASLLSRKINCSYQDGSLIVSFSGENLPPQTLLQVFNPYGECLINETITSNRWVVDVSTWTSGIYFIKVESPQSSPYSTKIMITR